MVHTPVFISKSLNFDYTDIGVVFSLSTLAQTGVLLFSGPLGMKMGYKRTILLGISMMLVGRLAQVLYPTIAMLALGDVLLGIDISFSFSWLDSCSDI